MNKKVKKAAIVWVISVTIGALPAAISGAIAGWTNHALFGGGIPGLLLGILGGVVVAVLFVGVPALVAELVVLGIERVFDPLIWRGLDTRTITYTAYKVISGAIGGGLGGGTIGRWFGGGFGRWSDLQIMGAMGVVVGLMLNIPWGSFQKKPKHD